MLSHYLEKETVYNSIYLTGKALMNVPISLATTLTLEHVVNNGAFYSWLPYALVIAPISQLTYDLMKMKQPDAHFAALYSAVALTTVGSVLFLSSPNESNIRDILQYGMAMGATTQILATVVTNKITSQSMFNKFGTFFPSANTKAKPQELQKTNTTPTLNH